MRLQDLFELLLLAMIWGVSFLFMRIATPEFGVIPLMALRLVIGTLILLPLLLWRAQMTDLKTHGKQIFVLGVLNSAIPFCLLAYATLTFTAGFTSIINATVPLWAALVAFLWLKDKLSTIAIFGLMTGFAGVVFMAWDKGSLAQGNYVISLLAGLGATLCYGACSVYSKARLSHVNSLALATGSLAAGTLFLLPPAIVYWPTHEISDKAWWSALAMGVVCTGFAYVLFFRLIANLGAAKAVTVTYLIPIFAMVFGTLLLDEQVTTQMLIGCALILFGTALATGLIKLARKASKTKVSC
jgi:drug/metabolite transporter (DMT)-like permease